MLNWLQKLMGDGNSADAPNGAASEKAPAPPQTAAAALAQKPVATAHGSLSRQPILDAQHHVFAYQFTQRTGDAALLAAAQHEEILKLAQFRQLWLCVSEWALAEPGLQALPPATTVLVVHPSAHPAPAVLELANQRVAEGYGICVQGYADNEGWRAWAALARYVTLEITHYAPTELPELVRQIRTARPGVLVVAQKIDSYEAFEFCTSAGFDGFAGAFLTRRENWPPQPPLHPDRVRLISLLNTLRAGGELSDIANGLRTSPTLSYRFLRYINSPALGTSTPLASLEQGVLYLGREKLYRWLTLLMFLSDEGRSTDGALLEQALVRGRTMEMLGLFGKLNLTQCDELFVVGMFSLLDVLLRLPLPLALEPLKLPEAATDALLNNSGKYAEYLHLAVAMESSDAGDEAIRAAAESRFGLGADALNDMQAQAISWAQQLVGAPPA